MLGPTERLLNDIYANEGPTVTLQARLTATGAIRGLSVLVCDRTLAQVLHLPMELRSASATVAEVLHAAELWTTILEGNGSDCE